MGMWIGFARRALVAVAGGGALAASACTGSNGELVSTIDGGAYVTVAEASADAATNADGTTTGDKDALACGTGQTTCGAICTDVTKDSQNCGGCGHACNPGELCSDGRCALSCNGGTSRCDSACKDLSVDPQNCGTCGNACASGQLCDSGSCVVSCGGQQTACNGGCVDTTGDRGNCGACGHPCDDGEVCQSGACVLSCQKGLTVCPSSAGVGDGGTAGDAALAGDGETSSDGATAGDGGVEAASAANVCVDLQTDNTNCGSCGNACGSGQVCADGACAVSCGANASTACGPDDAQYCANLQIDNDNCGACGNVCPRDTGCLDGSCTASTVASCISGPDPGTSNLTWVVCSATYAEAWVSMLNQGGQFHAEAICKGLGYAKLGAYGGTCGNVCGYCQASTSCSNPGKKTFDGGGTCGSDNLGQILCSTVMWQCLP